MGFGSRQDEDSIRRWFLKGLEQGIGGTGTEHMDFVYDIHLVAGLVGSVVDLLAQAADIVNTGVAGSVNLDYVERPTLGDCPAHFAGVAGLALTAGETVDRFGEAARGAGLACSARATEKVGMR